MQRAGGVDPVQLALFGPGQIGHDRLGAVGEGRAAVGAAGDPVLGGGQDGVGVLGTDGDVQSGQPSTVVPGHAVLADAQQPIGAVVAVDGAVRVFQGVEVGLAGEGEGLPGPPGVGALDQAAVGGLVAALGGVAAAEEGVGAGDGEAHVVGGVAHAPGRTVVVHGDDAVVGGDVHLSVAGIDAEPVDVADPEIGRGGALCGGRDVGAA